MAERAISARRRRRRRRRDVFEAMSKLAADIVKVGAVRLRGAAHRPAPSLFAMPGLNSRADWGGAAGLARYGADELAAAVHRMEESADWMRDEYEAAKAARAADGRAASDYSDAGDHSLHGGDWNWLTYVDKGVVLEGFGREAPITTSLLQSVPRLMTESPFGFAFFSALGPGAEIQPHCSPMNLRVRVHVPLIVPAGDVGLGLAGSELRWEPGKALVFDDSYVHHVWNRGKDDRVLLLFDVWHPDLHDEEIEAIKAMFAPDRGS